MSSVSLPADVQHVPVQLGDRSYSITIGQGLLASVPAVIAERLAARFGPQAQWSALLVTDENVQHFARKLDEHLTAAGWRTSLYAMPAGENSKRLEMISAAWDQLVEFQADRRTVVIAVGGGVVGDAAGFIAATFVRGLPFVQVPTTLLADVDSSVGGKVGINHPRAKNLIGAFHQPLAVIIDTQTFETLPEREYLSGLAEVVKYGVILDAEFFADLEQHAEQLRQRDAASLRRAISRSCELKAYVVERDEYETTGLRAVLNYGHTFCHAFEALTGYGELLHGEAVSIGMVYASRLAEKLGRITPEVTERQTRLLAQLGLPLNLPDPQQISLRDVLDRMRLDKKTVGGRLRFVLPSRLGAVELVKDVPEELVIETLRAGGLAE